MGRRGGIAAAGVPDFDRLVSGGAVVEKSGSACISICCRRENFLLFQGHRISFPSYLLFIHNQPSVLSGRFVSFGAMYHRLLQVENF
jgi:hypothetical protein